MDQFMERHKDENKREMTTEEILKGLRKEDERMRINILKDVFNNYIKDNEWDPILHKLRKGNELNKIINAILFYWLICKHIKHAGIILIGIFSIMESVSINKYLTFDEWVLSNNKIKIKIPINDLASFKKTIKDLQTKYIDRYGCAKKVREFVNKYFSDPDKTRLIGGVKIYNENGTSATIDKLDGVVMMLYNERNDFVHNARIPQIDKQDKIIGSYKIYNKKKIARLDLSINDIKTMFEKAFVKLLKS